MSISERVLKKIKKHQLKPKPRWLFLTKNYFLWFLGLVFLVIGGFAFSVVIYMFKENDWEVYEKINDSLLEFILLTLPYFWLLVLASLILIVHYNLKNTKSGYRYRLPVIVVGAVIASLLLGAFLFRAGVGQAIDEIFADKIPVYERFVNKINQRQKVWMHPERGLLIGIVVMDDNDLYFRLNDFNNQVWVVYHDNARVMGPFDILVGNGVRVIGEEFYNPSLLVNERGFKAKMIFPASEQRWLKRHPGMRVKSFNLRSGTPEIPDFMQGDLWNREYTEENLKPKSECWFDRECQVPFHQSIRSNCAFEGKCLEGKCRTACVQPYESKEAEKAGKAQCKYKPDCNCKFYKAEDKKDCLCLEGRCVVIVE